jgi:hypothetical protein
MAKSDVQCETECLMTRKLLMTVAIVAIALVPSICIGIAQARAFGGGFGGDGFHGGGYGRGFYGGYGGSIRVTMDMAIPHIVTTAIDRVHLAAWNGAGPERSQSPAYRRGLGYLLPQISSSAGLVRIPRRGDIARRRKRPQRWKITASPEAPVGYRA